VSEETESQKGVCHPKKSSLFINEDSETNTFQNAPNVRVTIDGVATINQY